MKHIHYSCRCTSLYILGRRITHGIYCIPYSLHWTLWQTRHTFSVWSRLSLWIWQTVQVIDFMREAWWEISTGAIRDQRSSHCLTFIGSLTLSNFLWFIQTVSVLYEKSMKDLGEDCKTSLMTHELMNLMSSLTQNLILIPGRHYVIGNVSI